MKNYKKKISIALVVILIGLVVWAVNNPDDSKGGLKIGVIAPLSGLVVGDDNLGQGFANGVLLAHEEYVADNPDINIDVVIEDDGYDSKKGVAAYQKLTSVDNIDALINLSSVTIDSIIENVTVDDLPVIQLGAESVLYEDNIYQIYPDQTSIGILGEVADQDGVKKLVVATLQIKAYDKFLSDIDAQYDGELEIQKIAPDETNLASLALRIKEIDPDGVMIFMDSKKGPQLIKKMNEIGYKPKNLYIDQNLQWGIADYQEILGDLSLLENSKSLYDTSEVSEEFQNKYKSRFKVDIVPSMAGLGYDSYMTMVANYDSNSNTWRKNMNKYSVVGVTGNISFNPLGLRPSEFKIAEIINGILDVK